MLIWQSPNSVGFLKSGCCTGIGVQRRSLLSFSYANGGADQILDWAGREFKVCWFCRCSVFFLFRINDTIHYSLRNITDWKAFAPAKASALNRMHQLAKLALATIRAKSSSKIMLWGMKMLLATFRARWPQESLIIVHFLVASVLCEITIVLKYWQFSISFNSLLRWQKRVRNYMEWGGWQLWTQRKVNFRVGEMKWKL